MLTFIKNLGVSPEDIDQQVLSKKLNALSIVDSLEDLSDSLSDVIDQGGTNTLIMLLNSLNSLLALKLTGVHKLHLYNIPLELTFNNIGGLVSMRVLGSLPNKQSKHLKPAIKRDLP